MRRQGPHLAVPTPSSDGLGPPARTLRWTQIGCRIQATPSSHVLGPPARGAGSPTSRRVNRPPGREGKKRSSPESVGGERSTLRRWADRWRRFDRTLKSGAPCPWNTRRAARQGSSGCVPGKCCSSNNDPREQPAGAHCLRRFCSFLRTGRAQALGDPPQDRACTAFGARRAPGRALRAGPGGGVPVEHQTGLKAATPRARSRQVLFVEQRSPGAARWRSLPAPVLQFPAHRPGPGPGGPAAGPRLHRVWCSVRTGRPWGVASERPRPKSLAADPGTRSARGATDARRAPNQGRGPRERQANPAQPPASEPGEPNSTPSSSAGPVSARK